MKDGLRIGMRVLGGQWSAGGSVRAQLWLHNAGAKDASFQTAGPNRQDVEVMFSAIDTEGNEHWPEINPMMLIAMRLNCTLPAGHVAMVKAFDVTFADTENDVTTPLGHRFLNLKPGKYQLRCKWVTAKPEPAKPDDRIEFTAPNFAFTLGGTAADDAKTAPVPDAADISKDGEISMEGKKMSPPIKTIPVTSKDLSGIWYGVTDRTGVVVRFIGRESRIKDTQGTVSGEWVVHVVDGSVGATLDFTDDPKAGVVRITAGMWNVKTKQSYTSSLGSIERGEDDTLYLTINDNPKEPMYLQAKRIRLTFIEDRDEIQRSDIEKMQARMQSLKPR